MDLKEPIEIVKEKKYEMREDDGNKPVKDLSANNENEFSDKSHELTNEMSFKFVDQNPEISEEETKTRLEKSTNLKTEGNTCFKNEEYEKAIEFYNKSLNELMGCSSVDNMRSIILNNKAVCKWKLLEKSQRSANDQLDFKNEKLKTEFDEIINLLDQSIELDSTYFKPYLKRAELYHKFGGEKLDNSLEDYKKLLKLVPNSNKNLLNDIKHEIFRLEKEIEQRNEQLKQEMFSKLKDLGNLCLKPFGLSTDNFKLQQNENGGYSINFQQ